MRFRNGTSYFSISCQKRSMLTRRKIDTGEHWPPSTTCLVSLALKRERVSGDEIQPHRWNDNCSAVIANVSLGFTFAPLRNRRTYGWGGESRALGNHFFIPIFARGNGQKSMEIDRSIKWKRTCELRRIIEERKNCRELWKKEIGSIQFFLGKFVARWNISREDDFKIFENFSKTKARASDSMHYGFNSCKENYPIYASEREDRCLPTQLISIESLFFSVSIRNPIHIWRRYISIFFKG